MRRPQDIEIMYLYSLTGALDATNGFVQEMPTRTLRLGQSSQRTKIFKGILDSGCEGGDLISEEVISALDLWSEVECRHEVIGTCLNGSDLVSVGTIVLRVNGLGLCKIFNTRFYVVAGESLSWQVVLGASTCANHHLLKVGAYGLRVVQPKKSKGEHHLGDSYGSQANLC